MFTLPGPNPIICVSGWNMMYIIGCRHSALQLFKSDLRVPRRSFFFCNTCIGFYGSGIAFGRHMPKTTRLRRLQYRLQSLISNITMWRLALLGLVVSTGLKIQCLHYIVISCSSLCNKTTLFLQRHPAFFI